MKKLYLLKITLAALIASVALSQSSAYAAKPFTIAVVSDTQNYIDVNQPKDSYEVYVSQMQYLADHKNDLNLVFVTHVGDIVENGDGTNGNSGDTTYGAGLEWERARIGIDILAASGVPFGVSIGNHDYDNYRYTRVNGNRPLAGVTLWNANFGSDSPYFAGKSWYGGASNELECNSGISSFQVFSAGGRKMLNISLEMEAGDEALKWAQGVIDMHPGYPTIVTTHIFLRPPSRRDDSQPLEVTAERITASFLKGSPGGWNDADAVWEKFISENDQIFMVLCGHAYRYAFDGVSKSQNIRIDLNDAGHPVYQLLTDYQGNTSGGSAGGDGWLRLMTFDMEAGAIHCRTYSTMLNKYAGSNGEDTFRQTPEFSDFVLEMPVQVIH